ncbi:FAR-17a/AIG1-like protein [Fusarium tricinctum]|uniref:FAR-17a/AIG1-like protein n=1 Tax=Fusarium tricinctum TaxID=61284 RepID=A0A8K0WB78_9HYPO|nr:FAR-17a/AIG1-like protein [Fusarium tricinctum]
MAHTSTGSATSRNHFLITLFHAAGSLSFIYCFYLLTTWDSIYARAFGWYFQFLTVIGVATSLITFVFGLAADLTLQDVFFRAKNAVTILATPLEVLITFLYWSIRSHDPALLMSQELFNGLDPWPDIGFHIAPAAFLAVDFLLLSPHAIITTRSMLSLSTISALLYWCWCELCFYQNGWYPYPLMDRFTVTQRVLVFIGSAGILTLSSCVLQWMHSKVNDPMPKKLRVG